MAWWLGVENRGNSQNRGSQLPRPISPSIWSNFLFSLRMYTTCLWVNGSPGWAGSGRGRTPACASAWARTISAKWNPSSAGAGHFGPLHIAAGQRHLLQLAVVAQHVADEQVVAPQAQAPRKAARRDERIGRLLGPPRIDQGHGVVARIGGIQRLSVGADRQAVAQATVGQVGPGLGVEFRDDSPPGDVDRA